VEWAEEWTSKKSFPQTIPKNPFPSKVVWPLHAAKSAAAAWAGWISKGSDAKRLAMKGRSSDRPFSFGYWQEFKRVFGFSFASRCFRLKADLATLLDVVRNLGNDRSAAAGSGIGMGAMGNRADAPYKLLPNYQAAATCRVPVADDVCVACAVSLAMQTRSRPECLAA
jgi:hypothetical protein